MLFSQGTSQARLLGSHDPAPVEIVHPDSKSPIVLICEHAGRTIPQALRQLGLPQSEIDRHIGWDIGAEGVARALAAMLGATLILQRYSRLVIDCNRPPHSHSSIVAVSDGTAVPGNAALSPVAAQARIDEIFQPFDDSVSRYLDTCRIALAIHSFNPVLEGVSRPWDIGFLYRKDVQTSKRLAAYLALREPALVIGMNEPYSIDDETDWFVPRHGERTGVAHSLIEIRNDLIDSTAGQAQWADRLNGAIEHLLKELST